MAKTRQSPLKICKRQLGLLRRHSTTQQSRDVKKIKRTNQVFSYLIVIDFESTCWKDKKNVSQEVIEFPAVLLNTSTGSIEAEFHTYVLPEENPQLSAFCTELTGITQDQVEAGIPLRLCLSKFSRWLKKLEDEKHIAYNSGEDGKRLCTFVTWSDWDLSVCLHYECRRKQLIKPPALNSWIDLRATYKNFYQRKPNGLHGALQDVGIEFHGRQHSGLDDARNTASLAWRMMCDGCVLKITRTLPGTQQLKRKQATQPSEQPNKAQAIPNTNLQRQEPDSALIGRCAEPEDRLVSHTQGICEEAVYGDISAVMSASDTSHFKIWEDTAQIGSVRSVIRPQTSIPSVIGNGLRYHENGGKSGRSDPATELIPVQTSLEVQFKDQDNGSGSGNKQIKTKLHQSSKIRNGIPVIKNTFGAVRNVNSCVASSSSSSSSIDSSSRFVNGKSVDSKFGRDVASHVRELRPKSASENPIKTADKQVTGIPPCTGSDTPNSSNCSKHTDSVIPRLQQLNGLSSCISPASLSRSAGATTAMMPVFKTPTNVPLRKSGVGKPPSGFKTPYASAAYCTPGSTNNFGTPAQSSRTLTTPPLLGGKITPPMCQCGRRAKRRTVLSPGPNMDRPFYSCALGRRSSEAGLKDVTNIKKGCGYFKWESVVLAEKQLLLSASPATPQNWLPQKQQRGVHGSNAIRSPSPATVTPTAVTGSGKRLGIAMRALLRQQAQKGSRS